MAETLENGTGFVQTALEPAVPLDEAPAAEQQRWIENHPGSPSHYREIVDFDQSGEQVVVREALMGPEDVTRIETVAADFDLDHFDGQRQQIAEAYKAIRQGLTTTESRRREKNTGVYEQSEVFERNLQAELEEKRQELLALTSEHLVPYPEGSGRRERKHLDRQRANLVRMLTLPEEQFAQLEQDWEGYRQVRYAEEMDFLHAEALKDDKKLNAKSKNRAAKSEMLRLDDKYDGTLAAVSELPLFRELSISESGEVKGGLLREARSKVADILEAGKDRYRQADGDKWDQANNVAKVRLELQAELKARYEASGLSEAEVEAKLAEAEGPLEDWVDSAVSKGSDPIADLERYDQAKASAELWGNRRKKAWNYLGSLILKDSFAQETSPESAAKPEAESEVDLRQLIAETVDYDGLRPKEAAKVLKGSLGTEATDSYSVDSYLGRVKWQLELARNLGRNQGSIMRSALYLAAMAKNSGETFVRLWKTIPETQKKRARKELMMGMTVTSKALASWARRKLKKQNG